MFQRSYVLVPLLLAATVLQASESKLTFVPPVAAVAAQPAIAPAGVARKLVVSGMWPNACPPTSAQLGFPPSRDRKEGIGILLSEPQTFAPCAQALTAYRFELEYTPTTTGQVEILVMTTQGTPLATGTLVTGDEKAPKALYDVGGSWYDPQTPGSGVQLTHDYAQTDAVFATWAVFDSSSGAPRWYSLQQGQWSGDGLSWRGVMYEVVGAPSGCAAPCASPLSRVVFVGAVQLTFTVSYIHGGLDAVMDLLPEGAAPRRLSSLVRFVPYRIVIQ